jgi:hypothetical protein
MRAEVCKQSVRNPSIYSGWNSESGIALVLAAAAILWGAILLVLRHI